MNEKLMEKQTKNLGDELIEKLTKSVTETKDILVDYKIPKYKKVDIMRTTIIEALSTIRFTYDVLKRMMIHHERMLNTQLSFYDLIPNKPDVVTQMFETAKQGLNQMKDDITFLQKTIISWENILPRIMEYDNTVTKHFNSYLIDNQIAMYCKDALDLEKGVRELIWEDIDKYMQSVFNQPFFQEN